jgi:hypothetical protein
MALAEQQIIMKRDYNVHLKYILEKGLNFERMLEICGVKQYL